MLSTFDDNNLVTFRGDDLAIKLSFLDTADVPVDITGWTIFFTIKKTKDARDAEAVLEYDVNTFTNPTTGEVLLTIPNTTTIKFGGLYWYDIQIKKADNTIQTITSGSIDFKRDVTRRIIPTT